MPEPHEVTKREVPAAPSACHPSPARTSRATSTAPAAWPTSCSASGSPTSSGSGTSCPRSTCGRRPGRSTGTTSAASLTTHESCQRAYALNEEGGVLQCTWPRGGRPRYPFPYADECWTGIRVPGRRPPVLRGRGGGRLRDRPRRPRAPRRHPAESLGRVRVRPPLRAGALVLVAPPGPVRLRVQRARGRLKFAPRVSTDGFRCFFSTGTAWGIVALGNREATVSVEAGELRLRRLEIGERAHAFESPRVVAPGRPLRVEW